ncbi:cytochrome c biogenesis CcdA family protein [Helcobacillus massiliensis]|uniref:Cytochrome c biogenesis protein CcdA n=1 Tax=Helcobacillus massiliensis TaxID=521392 RepID=A0A839QP24_9MICO|nr:cytochrome c biogenesis CcdA family protein [Helcobacillus massiliensis]MBB3022243.1 cytochrome c biogenesis protein CcdA [Helcobacillus massiliensis]MDK7742221.1 cytochrome c biogenesis CcdA family protein [Helcobacillus massiliensis]WOO93773.1 cytochrome c biogenesis CcdA family protein [Helcobacillus massiliensis]
MDLGFLGAFLGGALTLLSPCSVMLLPAFFSYAFADRTTVLTRTGVFYLGLITTLVPLGILAGSLGALVNQHRSTLVTVVSILVIVLGALLLLNIPIPGLSRLSSAPSVGAPGAPGGSSSISALSTYALGTVYGVAGVCAGPMLGAVLAFAAFSSNALYGGLILLVFAAGMTAPLLILALVWTRLPWVRSLVRPREVVLGPIRTTWTAIIAGVLTIGIGVLMLLTQGTANLGGVLGARDQAQLEANVMSFSRAVPNWVTIAVAAAVLAAVVAWNAHRRGAGRGGQR